MIRTTANFSLVINNWKKIHGMHLQDTFAVGTIHEGTVTRKDDKGAMVQLPYGLEGFAPNRHLTKEDGKTVDADETAQFMVIEFDRNEKRIVLSIPVSGNRLRLKRKMQHAKKPKWKPTKTRKL